MKGYSYQCDVCYAITLSGNKAANVGDCSSGDGGIYHFIGVVGNDAAIRNLINSVENILVGADMSLDENKWLWSAKEYAKSVVSP